MNFFKTLLIIFAIIPCCTNAQKFSAEDLAKSKEINATIVELLSKATSNFEGMRGEEVAREATFSMYKATATPKMYAQDYYITLANSNNRSYYMAWYSTQHEIDLAIASIMDMPKYDGEKWKIVLDKNDDKNINAAFLYYNGAKVGKLREDVKGKTFSFSIGLFDNILPGSSTSGSLVPTEKKDNSKSKNLGNQNPSGHLTVTGNIITVRDWGEKFDGDYDVVKLAADSCVSGNCEDGKGRKILAGITGTGARIRIMEGKFKHNVFLGDGVMLIDGEDDVVNGTYELGKFKINYKHNTLQSKTTFHSEFTKEDVEGNFSGYLDDDIGSALPEYRKFVVCKFAPEDHVKPTSVWERDLYLPAYNKWLIALQNSPEFKAAQAKNAAETERKLGPQNHTSNNSTPLTKSQSTAYKASCPMCYGSGYYGQGSYISRNGTNVYERPRCTYCGGKGYVMRYSK